MNNCAICETNLGFFNRRKIANDEAICESCLKKAKTLTPKQIIKLKTVTLDEVKQSIEKSIGSVNYNFTPTYEVGDVVKFDDNNKKFLIPLPIESIVVVYDDVVSFELIEDGESVASGGVGRALVGGALFGGAGAVVGAVTAKKKQKEYCTNLKIKLTVQNNSTPDLYITFLTKKLNTNTDAYKTLYNQAQECLSKLELICNN